MVRYLPILSSLAFSCVLPLFFAFSPITAQAGRVIMENIPATNSAIYIDTQTIRVGIGTSSPAYALDVNGDINGTNIRGNGSYLTGVAKEVSTNTLTGVLPTSKGGTGNTAGNAATATTAGTASYAIGAGTAAPVGSASGDLSGSYPGPTLAASGVTAGAYGSASVVPTLTVDAKGRLTAVSSNTITPAAIGAQVVGSYSGIGSCSLPNVVTGVNASGAPTCGQPSNISGNAATANQASYAIGAGTAAPVGSASGDLTGTYPGPTLAASGVTAGAYGSASVVPTLTIDGKGRVTAVSSSTITAAGIGAAGTTGSGASGLWAINIQGNAVSASTVPASGVQSGTLGAGVVASSVAVNGITPTQVALGTYSNITLPGANVSGSITGNAATATTATFLTTAATVTVNASMVGNGSNGSALGVSPSSGTLMGNIFNGASQLVQLKSDGTLPAISGQNLTGLPSTPGGAVLVSSQTFSGSNTFSGAGVTTTTFNNIGAIGANASGYFALSQRTVFTSGSGTYTVPTSGGQLARQLRVRMCAGGGGGGATVTNVGSAGAATTFNGSSATPGGGGGFGNGVTQGAAGTGGFVAGSVNTSTITWIPGGYGNAGPFAGSASSGGQGASSQFGGGGPAGANVTAGQNAAGYCGGGGGAGYTTGGYGAGGGGAGEYVEIVLSGSLSSTYSYAVGSGGNGGAVGTHAGGNGAGGIIIIDASF